MATLPGGFSPVNFVKEGLDTINPLNGDQNYNVFSQHGNQRNGLNYDLGASRNSSGLSYNDGFGTIPTQAQSQSQQPNQPLNDSNEIPQTLGLSATSSGPAYNQSDIDYLDSQRDQYQGLLGRTDTALQSGLTNLSDSFNRSQSDLNDSRSRGLRDLAIQSEDNQRARQSNLNQVNTNARTLANSLRRILGLASGSGSSAYLLAGPEAVARRASSQRAGAIETAGRNDRALSIARDDAESQYDRLIRDLQLQRNSAESQLREGVEQQRQSINEVLADIARQRALTLGGGFAQVRAAQAPFVNAINSSRNAVDGLFNEFRTPQLAVDPVAVNAPSLSDFLVDRAAINVNQSGADGQYSPYRALLRREEEER